MYILLPTRFRSYVRSGSITMLSFFFPFFLPFFFLAVLFLTRFLPSSPLVLRRNGMEKCIQPPRRLNVSQNFFGPVISGLAVDFSAPGSLLTGWRLRALIGVGGDGRRFSASLRPERFAETGRIGWCCRFYFVPALVAMPPAKTFNRIV